MKVEKIKVFLADPQILFREGIHFTLSGEEDFEVIGEATSNEEAFAFIEANPPTVAILSMKNGKLDGPAVTHRIKRNLPSVAVILVSDSDAEELLFAAMKSGASAFLTKDTDPEYLVSIIREVAEGNQPLIEVLLMPGLASRVLGEFDTLSSLSELLGNLLVSLSPRETEILNQIAAGNGIEQVAAKLNSNEESIRHQLRLIVNKLVTNEQTRTVIEAAQRSLPSIIPGATLRGKPTAEEYITRDEFNEFKDSLMQRLKSFIGELA